MNITLLSVNWNARPAMELMLKSFVTHHGQVRLMLADNGSTDDSKQWLYDQGIPFLDFPTNIGHEQMLNVLYPAITTKYVLLVDTDVIFNDSVFGYFDQLVGPIVAAGDLINGDQLNSPIKPRLGAWFIAFDIERMRSVGVTKFRTKQAWDYDVASEFYENIWMNNLQPLIIDRLPGNIDNDVEGMKYGKFSHLGKVSWDLSKHGDREHEVKMRRDYINLRLNEFKDVDLKGKFV